MGKNSIELKSIAGKTRAGKHGILKNGVKSNKYRYSVKYGSGGDVGAIDDFARKNPAKAVKAYGLRRSKEPDVGGFYYIVSSMDPFFYKGGGGEFSFLDEDRVEVIDGTLKGSEARRFINAIPYWGND